MMSSNDQAAGLRAMLNQAPPEVLAVVPCGAAAMRWIARQAQQRAALGQRVLAFDEWQISGNFSDCVGVVPRFDLQQAVEGHIALEHCIAGATGAQTAAHSVRVLSVARLSREIDGDRILQQRTLDCLLRLQSFSDEWLLLARPCDLAGLSSFARAAPRLLLVVEPVERAITEAYAALKRLARGADTLAVGISVAGADDARSRLLLTRFRQVAASHLGIEVQAVNSVGEAIGLAGTAAPDAGGASVFAERLLGRARSAAAAIASQSRGPAMAW
jgi:MinD-like ATPase involved in chromosome partitioning or flagellar assembly